MPISSVLNPEKIVGKQNKSFSAAQKFISGENAIGSSVLTSAANKIVGLQRANVTSVTPEINSIVNTISQNVVSNFDSQAQKIYQTVNQNLDKTSNELVQNYTTQVQKVEQLINTNFNKEVNNFSKKYESQFQNVYQSINNTVNKTLSNFSENYKKRTEGVDAAKPNAILEKFLKTYRSTLEFAQYFGNKKNLDNLRGNLNNVQKFFNQSFETAKSIREVIVKIVKQLSNLPQASPSGGGGINVDVDVPGGGLKQTAPKGLLGMMKGKGRMVAMGAGALGLGVLGAGTVNALSDSGILSSNVTTNTETQIPEDMMDKFSSIVDRFYKAIDSILRGAGTQKTQGSSSAGFSSGFSASPPAGSSGPSSYSPGTIPKEVAQDTSFTSGITELAKKYNVPEDYIYAVMGFETEGTFSPSIRNKKGSGATGLIQFMPTTAKGLGTTTDELSKMNRTEQLKYVDKYFSGTLNKGASLSDVYMSVLMPAAVGKPENTILFGPGGIIPNGYSQNAGLDLNGDGIITKAEATKKVEAYLPKNSRTQLAQITAAPTAAESRQQTARQVSQVPASRQNQQPIVMPIDLSGRTQQQPSGGSGGISSPPPNSGGGPTVPFLPSSNPDNFLVLYSRMVYNIVDG